MADTSRYFGIGLDTGQLKKQADEARKAFDRIGEEAVKQSGVIDKAFSGKPITSGLEKEFERLSKMSIDAFGSLSENARRTMTEMQEDILSLSNLEKMMQRLDKSYEEGTVSTQDYLKAQARLAVLHEQITDSIRQQEQALKRDAAQMDIAGDSITSMQAKVALLTNEYMRLSEAQRTGTQGEGILKQMSELQQKLDAAQASMQRFGMAGRTQFNMLGMSMQQIVRELPSLAMGPQMFFLAISNNLPIFTDALAQARKEYQLLTAAGKKATPVWKQVMSSLFSWQTALSALPAVLIVLGPQIANFFQSFFTGKEKIDSATDALKNINTELESSNANYGENVITLKTLADEWKNLTDEASKTKWIEDNQSEFGKLQISINDVSDAENAFVANTPSVIEALQLRAQAAAAQSLAEEKYREAFLKKQEAEEKRQDEEKNGLSFWDSSKKYFQAIGRGFSGKDSDLSLSTRIATQDIETESEALLKQSKAIEENADAYYNLYTAKSLAASKKLKDLGLGDEGGGTGSGELSNLKSYLDEYQRLVSDNEDRQVDLMKDGTDKQLAEISLRYRRMRDKVRELESGLIAQQGGQLTREQQELLAEAYKGIDAQEQRDYGETVKGRMEAERDSMNAFLADYGTFQQKKLAIAQEYARKIAAAQTEGDRLSLEKERDQKLSGMEAEALKMSIDWPAVFGEFGGMFDDIMKPTLEKVKQYMQTDDFRNLQPTDQNEIVEAVNRMEQSLGGAGKVSFKQLGKEVQTLQQSMRELNNAKQEEAEALQRLAEAQEAYENALDNGTDREKAAAELKLNAAKEEADNASENTRKAEENAQQNQKTTTETATTLKANMENVTQGLQQLASGGIQAAYEGLLKLAKGSGNDKMGEISDKLGDVFIIGWILSILDILKDGLSTVVEGLLDGIFSAISGILSDVLSGDLFVTLFDSIKSGVGSILDAITFGGFSSWTSSSNAKEVQATIDRLTDRNEALQSSIDALNDTMKEARGTETVQAAKQAEEYQKEVNRNYLEMAMAQAGYHGSHHSWNYYWGGFSKEQIDKLSEQIGREWSGSLWDLSPEEMKMLKGNVDMWTQIQNTGEGGYGGRLTEKLDDYIDQAGKLEEITDTLYESLTQISFDSMYDSFVDNLMNMEYSAQDAADDIAEYFMRAMLSNKIGALYQDKLEEWYKKFAGAMEDDGTLDDGEIAALRDEYLGYVEEALKLRDDLAAATGYEGTSAQEQQSATQGYSTTMTQDQASELTGRFTAFNESALRIESKIDIGNVNLETVKNHVAETRDIIQSCYGELLQISENTGAIIQPIQQIQKDIAKVRENTARI